MRKKLVMIILLAVFSLLTFSCYKQSIIRTDEMTNNRGQILAVITNSGDWIEFDSPKKIANGQIVYFKNEGGEKKVLSISLSEIQRIWLRKLSVNEFLRKMYIGMGISSIVTIFLVILDRNS